MRTGRYFVRHQEIPPLRETERGTETQDQFFKTETHQGRKKSDVEKRAPVLNIYSGSSPKIRPLRHFYAVKVFYFFLKALFGVALNLKLINIFHWLKTPAEGMGWAPLLQGWTPVDPYPQDPVELKSKSGAGSDSELCLPERGFWAA
jgi:hypothetical protein